jgi:hypothetical protein
MGEKIQIWWSPEILPGVEHHQSPCFCHSLAVVATIAQILQVRVVWIDTTIYYGLE